MLYAGLTPASLQMATYRKRGDGWRAEVARLGVRDSATFDTKAQAVEWATKREAEILEGKGVGATKVAKTLNDAIDRYKVEVAPTKRGGRWEVVRLDLFKRTIDFVGERIGKINPDMIASWRDKRLQMVKSSSVNRELNLLSAVFEIARLEWKWLVHNPVQEIRRPKNPKPRDRRISDMEIRMMVRALGCDPEQLQTPTCKSHYIALAFMLAIETGMRQGEILGLTWGKVFLSQRYVTLEDTKNSDRRNVPLSTKAVEILMALPAGSPDEHCFKVSSASADALWRKARAKAKVQDLHFHDSRHEAVTRLSKKLEVLELARMIGHRDLKSLMVYYNATATELAQKLG